MVWHISNNTLLGSWLNIILLTAYSHIFLLFNILRHIWVNINSHTRFFRPKVHSENTWVLKIRISLGRKFVKHYRNIPKMWLYFCYSRCDESLYTYWYIYMGNFGGMCESVSMYFWVQDIILKLVNV